MSNTPRFYTSTGVMLGDHDPRHTAMYVHVDDFVAIESDLAAADAEIARLKIKLDADAKLGHEAEDEITALRAEVAALTEDAERYRWLRDFTMRKNLPEGAPWWSVSVEQGGVGNCYRGSKLDAAIDAARKP